MGSASLYVHVPFCSSKCDYCDFYSVVGRNIELPAYASAVVNESRTLLGEYGIDAVPTLYVGGGSPSLLGPAGIEVLLSGLYAVLPDKPDETTVEANPESVDGSFLAACAAAGVDRVSLGVQSLEDRCRRAVHRTGSGARALETVELALGHFGAAGVSADLIAGLPGQDSDSLERDIAVLAAAGVGHISLYSLTVEEGTPLHGALASGSICLPENRDELWLRGRDRLRELGYVQYEVSNFARPGAESAHNLHYWRMDSYLGAGPAAVGTLRRPGGKGLRLSVPPDLAAWTAAGSGASVIREELGRRECIEEAIIMGFRTARGVDGEDFRGRFGSNLEEFIGATLAEWRGRGLALKDAPALTGQGLAFLNPFLVSCLEELDATLPDEA